MLKVISGNKHMNTTATLEAVQFEPVEFIPDVLKAKIGIICLNEQGKPGILHLTRSEHEDTRVGGADWTGGTLMDGEDPLLGAKRERKQELPGIKLTNITEVDRAPRTRNGINTLTVIFLAALKKGPKEGLRFGENEDGKNEHCAASIVSFAESKKLAEMPRKYREAGASKAGKAVIAKLVKLAQPLVIPDEILETRWGIT